MSTTDRANLADFAVPVGLRPPKLSARNLVSRRRSASGESVVALDSVSFDVSPGEFVCLLGPSGCGKTTILNILAGLDRPTSGETLLDGRPIQGPGPDRAFLFQEPALFPWLSVAGNVELALRLIGVGPAERRERAMHWLGNVGISRSASSRPHELSAGMRQRVALARALACDPEVLLADEPFGALDAPAREILQNELQRIWTQGEPRKTLVLATHNVREAALLADRIVVMSAAPGRLLEELRLHSPRPRRLDDALISRVVSDVHASLMKEVDKDVARETGR